MYILLQISCHTKQRKKKKKTTVKSNRNKNKTNNKQRVKEHLNNENSVKKHIYSRQNKDYKGIEVKIIKSESDSANKVIYSFMTHFTLLESASLHSIPGRNVANSQTFYFSTL